MIEFIKSDKGKYLYWILGIIAAGCFAIIMLPPLYQYWNKLDPMVLGLPFSIFFMWMMAILIAVDLILIYHVDRIRGEL